MAPVGMIAVLWMVGLRPLVVKVLEFFIVVPRFRFIFFVEREAHAVSRSSSLHKTLQILLRTVLWQHVGDLLPLGSNTKEKWAGNAGILSSPVQPLATRPLPPQKRDEIDYHYCYCYYYHYYYYLCGGVARILAQYSLWIIKGDEKGQSKGSGKSLLSIFSYEKTGHRRGEQRKVSLNPIYLLLATTF